VIEGSTAAWPGFPSRVELCGDRGTIVLEDGRITGWKLADSTDEEEKSMLSLEGMEGSGASDPMGIGCAGHVRQINDLIDAVKNGRPPLVDGLEGRKAVEIICGIYESQRLGRLVRLPFA